MKTLTRSQKKYIRRQKAQIRVQFSDPAKQQLEIAEIYKRIKETPAEPIKTQSLKKDSKKQDKKEKPKKAKSKK